MFRRTASRAATISPPAGEGPDEASDAAVLVERMLAQQRAALLLRPQLAAQLTAQQHQQALRQCAELMALVPEGDVELAGWQVGQHDAPAPMRRLHVPPYYLDRFPVTNQQFQAFVLDGGYEQSWLWAPELGPRVRTFCDRSGQPGPGGWCNGRYTAGEEAFPVVQVSWYEADAYARWSGRRLPSDSEWVKAAAWPLPADGGYLVQQRFPWGNAVEPHRAALRRPGPVSTRELPEGAGAGGHRQLLGNVWEWTSSPLAVWHDGRPARLREPLYVLRGGAFDSYFDVQTDNQTQSGERPLARRANVGFRCAISACDVASESRAAVEELP